MEIAVPIFIGALETHSILVGRDGISLSRPLTHDLFINVFNQLDLSIKKIEIYEIKDDVFHARIIINGGEYTEEKPLVLDSRPSDAFALSERVHCPVFVSSAVIEQTGIPLDFFLDAIDENAETSGDEDIKYRALKEQLEQAVAEEEYEQAAEIRDMLKILEDDTD
jgi:bifunctional DNase/RNase